MTVIDRKNRMINLGEALEEKDNLATIQQRRNIQQKKKKLLPTKMFGVAVLVALVLVILREMGIAIVDSSFLEPGSVQLGEAPQLAVPKEMPLGAIQVDTITSHPSQRDGETSLHATIDTPRWSPVETTDKNYTTLVSKRLGRGTIYKRLRKDGAGQSVNMHNNSSNATSAQVISSEPISKTANNKPSADLMKPLDSVMINPYPVFAEVPKRPLSVGILTLIKEFTLTTKHFWGNGMEISNHFNLTIVCALKDNQNVDNVCYHAPADGSEAREQDKIGKMPSPSSVDLWIIDLVRLDSGAPTKSLSHHPILKRMLPPFNNETKVMIIDYRDEPFHGAQRPAWIQLGIHKLEHKRNTHWKNVRVVVGSCIIDRRWNPENNTIRLGKSAIINPIMEVGGGPVLHSSYAVRSDILQSVEDQVSQNRNGANSVVDDTILNSRATTTTINDGNVTSRRLVCEAIYMERPMDVIHLWDPTKLTKLQLTFARYRDAVSYKLLEMGNVSSTSAKNTTRIRSSITLQGKLGESGRIGVDQNYVRSLLNSKIVVVTQRDNWEDHYRLMEALSSGAMVMTDYMISLPQGFVNATNVVMFENVDQMDSLVRYYLAHEKERLEIAKRGVGTALGWHRAWHRIEWLVFGKPLTDVGTVKC